jgi:hypothetical protein
MSEPERLDTPRRRAAHWSDLAACRGLPLSLFFGPPADTMAQREKRADQSAREKEAAAVCAVCAVRQQCLDSELALPLSEQFGVFGGTTDVARRAILRAAEQEREHQGMTRAPRTSRIRVNRPHKAA